MTGRGWKHFRKFSEKFQTPTYPADKNSNPIKISKNDFRPTHYGEKTSHSSFERLSFDLPLSDRLTSVSVSVVYTSSKHSGKKKV